MDVKELCFAAVYRASEALYLMFSAYPEIGDPPINQKHLTLNSIMIILLLSGGNNEMLM